MSHALSRRLSSLEQGRPEATPVCVWLDYGENVATLAANARLAAPGRPVLIAGWMPPQEPQYSKLNDRTQS